MEAGFCTRGNGVTAEARRRKEIKMTSFLRVRDANAGAEKMGSIH